MPLESLTARAEDDRQQSQHRQRRETNDAAEAVAADRQRMQSRVARTTACRLTPWLLVKVSPYSGHQRPRHRLSSIEQHNLTLMSAPRAFVSHLRDL